MFFYFKTTQFNMAATRVILWNSAGLRASAAQTQEKLIFFDKEFPGGKFDIATFVETHHKNEDDLPDQGVCDTPPLNTYADPHKSHT